MQMCAPACVSILIYVENLWLSKFITFIDKHEAIFKSSLFSTVFINQTLCFLILSNHIY